MNERLERTWKRLLPYLRYYPAICLEVLRKATKEKKSVRIGNVWN
jgi:hypothetical protein